MNRLLTQLSKSAYLPLLDRIKAVDVHGAVQEALRNETLTRQALDELARKKLVALVLHARTSSPYYSATIGEAVSDEDLARLDSPDALPIVTKAQMQAEARQMLTVPEDKAQLCTTSGSTGVSMEFFIGPRHAAWIDASVIRGRKWWGVERGDLEVVLWARAVDASPSGNVVAWLKYRLRNRLQFDTFVDFSEPRARAIVESIQRVKPTVVYGYGSSLGRLAVFMRDEGLALNGRERPVFVEYTADHMASAEREAAREVFGAPILSAYGASEMGGIAQMCKHETLHVSTDHVWVEFLDSAGRPVEAGELGRIVVTGLNNWTMPVIRYDLQDVGRWIPEGCPCGSVLPAMELHSGKAIELIRTSFVSGVSAHVLDYINLMLLKQGISGIQQFFVEHRTLDVFHLLIVRAPQWRPESIELFIEKLREQLGPVDVTWEPVDEIPVRKSGKRFYYVRKFEYSA